VAELVKRGDALVFEAKGVFIAPEDIAKAVREESERVGRPIIEELSRKRQPLVPQLARRSEGGNNLTELGGVGLVGGSASRRKLRPVRHWCGLYSPSISRSISMPLALTLGPRRTLSVCRRVP